MKEAKVIIRKDLRDMFFGTVKMSNEDMIISSFCYDTQLFNTANEALNECWVFCKWKKLKIGKIVRLH